MSCEKGCLCKNCIKKENCKKDKDSPCKKCNEKSKVSRCNGFLKGEKK